MKLHYFKMDVFVKLNGYSFGFLVTVLNLSKCFAIFLKNVVQSLEPGETPSISASYQALNYVQRS